jgi:hypothetical protein
MLSDSISNATKVIKNHFHTIATAFFTALSPTIYLAATDLCQPAFGIEWIVYFCAYY